MYGVFLYSGASVVLSASVIGLEEFHPPALVGDVLLLRLAAVPALEIPCRIVRIDKRIHLLFVPAWDPAHSSSNGT